MLKNYYIRLSYEAWQSEDFTIVAHNDEHAEQVAANFCQVLRKNCYPDKYWCVECVVEIKGEEE